MPETGERIVLLFEGRDVAGKGGTIKHYMEHLNPRGGRAETILAKALPPDKRRSGPA